MKYSVAASLLVLSTLFFACEKDEDTQTGTQTIMPPTSTDTTAVSDTSGNGSPSIIIDFKQDFQNKREAFAGLVTRNTCGICGQSGHPNFDNYLNSREDITGISFNYSQNDPLYNSESREFASITNLRGTPSFTVGFNNYSNSPSTWQTEIANFESDPANAFIAMGGNTSNGDYKIQVQVAVANAATSNTPHLAVYVLENNIMSPQTDYSANPSVVQDYIHNHVYRGSATGLLGESISDMWATGDTITKVYNIDVSSVSNIDHAYFVAVLLEVDAAGKPVNIINSQQLYK